MKKAQTKAVWNHRHGLDWERGSLDAVCDTGQVTSVWWHFLHPFSETAEPAQGFSGHGTQILALEVSKESVDMKIPKPPPRSMK